MNAAPAWSWDIVREKLPVHVERERRDKWATEALEKVRAGAPSYDISSGDAVVIALRLNDGSIRVYDCMVRREMDVTP